MYVKKPRAYIGDIIHDHIHITHHILCKALRILAVQAVNRKTGTCVRVCGHLVASGVFRPVCHAQAQRAP